MTETFISWGPYGLAAAAFLSGSVAPLPSEAVLGALVALGRNPSTMTLIATIANVLGAATLLLAGSSGREWSDRNTRQDLLVRTERYFKRYGSWVLLFSWVPVIGDALVLAAGAFRVPWKVALPLLTLGKGLRYAAGSLAALSL